MTLYESNKLCSICKFRKTPIDGEHCGPCDIYFNDNFVPDWVDLICTHFKVSRNQAKKMYHKMVEDWRIRKNMEKITEGLKHVN